MSQFSGNPRDSFIASPTPSSPANDDLAYTKPHLRSSTPPVVNRRLRSNSAYVPSSTPLQSSSPAPDKHDVSPIADSPISAANRTRARSRTISTSRPLSMVQTYQPPLMEVNESTPPELLPIFSFLNSHGNKLYQEGYFLKLDDQNTRTSRPAALPAPVTTV